MSAPVNVLAVIDAERPLMAAASALTGVDTLAAHDAMRDAVAELIQKADNAASALSNLIAARQVDERYSGIVTDLTRALANVQGAAP